MTTFLVKVKKEEAAEGYSVPMHPELTWLKTIHENKWYARDGRSGSLVTIVKEIQNAFIQYVVSVAE